MNRPTLAQLRPVCQPESVLGRRNAEHWVGRTYMRHVSLRLTRALLPTPMSANSLTWLMALTGLLGAACLMLPGLVGALGAVAAMQVQILLDCSDGEVARWRRTLSPAGVYIDRIGHYVTEAALPIALGLRAERHAGLHVSGGWVSAGFLVAVIVLLNKAETDLVAVARAYAGLPLLSDDAGTAASTRSGLAAVRGMLTHLPFYRAFVAVEFSLLVLAAAVVDQVRGDLWATRFVLAVLVPLAVVTAVGHLVAVITSRRLR